MFRATRHAAAVLAALVLVSLTIGTTAAATGPVPDDFSFDERGVTAQAYWQQCTPAGADSTLRCVMTDVFVFDGRQRSRDSELGNANGALSYVCLNRHVEVLSDEGPIEPPTNEGGCAIDPQIAMDDLDSLLVSGAVDLFAETCVEDPETYEVTCEYEPSRTVSVEVAFTGVGAVLEDRWHSSSTSIIDGVRCHSLSSSRGAGRDAVATIAIDGESSGPSEFAFIVDGRTRTIQRCSA